ncbi:hypothetical protein ACLKA7_015430 [Drosophila subpalustris]
MNPPEVQTMNRRVLEALSIIQDGKSVSIEAIIQKVVPLMHRDDDLNNVQNNILESLSTLKQVGLVRESCNAEFTLCRCPVKSKSVSTRTRKSSANLSTQMKPRKMRSLLDAFHKPHKVMCTECRSALSSFTSCYQDLRQGRKLASRLQITDSRRRCQNIEPMEATGEDANVNVTAPDDVHGDGGENAATHSIWNFNAPIPIVLAEEQDH